MAAPPTSVCSLWADHCDPPCSYTGPVLDSALRMANHVLFEATGRRWPGVCTETVRPVAWCGCARPVCGCDAVSQFTPPGQPLISVTEVLVDGVVVPSARYRIDDYRHLIYLPESLSAMVQGWPSRQRRDLATTELDTWSVTYTYGSAPPPGGAEAVSIYACEIAKSLNPGTAASCALPLRVQSITRQGETMVLQDATALLDNGRTGILLVDQWLGAVNGYKRRGTVRRLGSSRRSTAHRTTG